MSRSLLALLLMLGLTGCVSTYHNPGLRTRAYLYDAYHAWESHQNADALAAIKRALASSQKENVPGHVLVEVYDDAGLYFNLAGQYQESALYQSIAVLLSRKIELSQRMKGFYQANLGTALASASPSQEIDEHAKDTERLLAIPGVRENPHIRKYYGL
jgi:hypothetical protein